MGGILECPGVFQLVVPDGWDVEGVPGEQYSLSTQAADVVVTISVFAITGPLDPPDEMLVSWATSLGAVARRSDVVHLPDEGTARDVLTFDADEMRWVAILMVGSRTAVLATAHAPLDDLSGLGAGERLIASIAPLAPRRRGWFGLRR